MKIIISVINDLATDQRVKRTAKTLALQNHSILVVGRLLPDSLPFTSNDYQTKRLTLIFRKKIWFYAEFNIRLFFYLLIKKFDLLISNDLDTLPANFLVSKIRRKQLIYDSHELFTEVPELINRKRVRNIWLTIEKCILPRVKHAATVSESIAEYYNKTYNTEMISIRNLPLKNNKLTDYQVVRPSSSKIIIYVGAVNVGRGIETAIYAMKNIENAHLLIVGDGDIFDEVKILTQKCKVSEKVIFTGKVTPEIMFQYITMSEIALCNIEDKGLSYRYSLPNKLFDYIQANIPVICSPLPEMKKIVELFGVGILTKDFSSENLADTINMLLSDESLYKKIKQNLKIASEILCWENEQQKLIDLVTKATNTVK